MADGCDPPQPPGGSGSQADSGAGPGPGPAPSPAAGDGLAWSFGLDADAVYRALGQSAARWEDINQDEDLADELAARDRGGDPPPVNVAGRVADALPAGRAWPPGCRAMTRRRCPIMTR